MPNKPWRPRSWGFHHRRRRAPNWAQQVAPYLELLKHRLGLDLPEVRFHYGVRICPEPAHWGGLSGCTYKEGVSWGKFVSPEEGGRFAEVLCDATIAWPLLLKGVSQRLQKIRCFDSLGWASAGAEPQVGQAGEDEQGQGQGHTGRIP